ncbi:ABC transporter permease, partial [Streptomyces sp. NPDC006333]
MSGLPGAGGFTGFAVRRLVGAVVTLLAISVIIYLVFYVAPGDVA